MDGERKRGERKGKGETGKGGRPGRERGGEEGKKWRGRERSGTGSEGRLFENVARGAPKMWPGAPSHLKTALSNI